MGKTAAIVNKTKLCDFSLMILEFSNHTPKIQNHNSVLNVSLSPTKKMNVLINVSKKNHEVRKINKRYSQVHTTLNEDKRIKTLPAGPCS